MSAQVLSLFPLSVYREVVPGAERLNADLEAFIRANRDRESAAAHSVRGGYQSPQDIFLDPADCVRTLREHIVRAVNAYIPYFGNAHGLPNLAATPLNFSMWGWVTVLTGPGFNAPHVHPRSTISGVYYVKSPPEVLANTQGDYSGWIGFLDPRAGSQMWPLPGQMNMQHLPPEPGSLILFPSYAPHFVPPTRVEDERICIAFNVKHAA